MHYVEIGMDIINEIKGGANWNGETESEEIIGTISEFGNVFSEIIRVAKEFFEELLKVFKK